ncbi:MAG: hypothetical protein ACREFY_10500 [Acetobacteraceae bacterium]
MHAAHDRLLAVPKDFEAWRLVVAAGIRPYDYALLRLAVGGTIDERAAR